MKDEQKRRAEFGDFQTPDELAHACCLKLASLGISPDIIIEPTCGVGAFVIAANTVFPRVKEIFGYELNSEYLALLGSRLSGIAGTDHVHIAQADFFDNNWGECLAATKTKGNLLILGNFPWVTSSQQGTIGGTNLPTKSNFQGHSGLDAMTGKANFDISEWMLLRVIAWLRQRTGAIGMLVKTTVARKVLVQAQQQRANVVDAFMFNIDAKKNFDAAVDACLLVIRFDPSAGNCGFDYTVFKDMNTTQGTRVGHRDGRTVGNLDAFDATIHLVGKSPQKWRSGVKHDAAAVMEFTRTPAGLLNGLNEVVTIEDTYLFPLLKGSDIGSNKEWRQKFTLVTQRSVGMSTESIKTLAPRTWQYLINHAAQLDARASSIYANTARFAVFGIGDYAYRHWKLAICALYKKLEFRLIGPIEGRPVMFDDTVYYISFDSRDEAEIALAQLNSDDIRRLLNSMIFWDEKRPIKTAILNLVDFEKVSGTVRQACLI
ncbi:MAG: SAM-dependent methyltransferase [Comamonadaceae bacterium]|nr:SAM-dependent methyltransferase [Comamonadaceae bacterium]